MDLTLQGFGTNLLNWLKISKKSEFCQVALLALHTMSYQGTMNTCNIALAKKSSKHIGQCCLCSKLTLQRGFCIACSGCIGCHENRKSLIDTSLKILTLKRLNL